MTTQERAEGFTLIEVVVVLVIVTIVGSIFAQAAFESISVTGTTSESLASTSSRYQVASLFDSDVRAAAAIGTTAGPQCDGPSSAQRVFWTDQPAQSGDATVTAWFVSSESGAGSRLTRVRCSAGDTGDPTTVAEWPDDQPVRFSCDNDQSCGGQDALATAVSPTDDTLTLADATGFPTAGPAYGVTVDHEAMTVVGGFGTTTLEVERASPQSHPVGTTVTYASRLVSVVIPLTSGTDHDSPSRPLLLSAERRVT